MASTTTRHRRYEVGDEVYSVVHFRKGTIAAIVWKPADRQWRSEWMYRLDWLPEVWLYECALTPATEIKEAGS